MGRKADGDSPVIVNMQAARCISNREDDYIELRLECDNSNIPFFNVRLTMQEFGELVSGASVRRKEAVVCGLDHVGKKFVHEKREIFCPLTDYKKSVLQEWLRENAQEEGWYLDTYLGSQGSTKSVDGGQLLRYLVYKYE